MITLEQATTARKLANQRAAENDAKRPACRYRGQRSQVGGNVFRPDEVINHYPCNHPHAEVDHCVATDQEKAWVDSKTLSCESCPLYVGPSDPNPIPREPVGDRLKDIFADAGIEMPPGCSCEAWRHKMNAWGTEGCERNRAKIVEYLTAVSEKAKVSLWDKVKIVWATKATTVDGLLDEAIRRAAAG